MSKRFMMQRFLGLTEDEIAENEKLWKEERDQPELETTQGQDLRSIGVSPGNIQGDLETGQELANLGEPGAGEIPGAGGVPPTAGNAAGPTSAPPPSV
jgi:hypothetical protein